MRKGSPDLVGTALPRWLSQLAEPTSINSAESTYSEGDECSP